MRIYGTKSTKTYYNLLQQFYEGEERNQKYPEPFGPEELMDLEIAALGSREYGMTSSSSFSNLLNQE